MAETTDSVSSDNFHHTCGLVLSGGGARAAYQVGVLRAVAEMLPNHLQNPFGIVSGTSAGALNAVAIASHANDFREAITNIERVWSNFSSDQVYRSDATRFYLNAGKWIASLVKGTGDPVALLDNTPLRELIENSIPLHRIQEAIDKGYLKAVSITASGYNSGESISFFQGQDEFHNWERSRRIGVKTNITIDHVMASSAIPAIFPAVQINREYFGDGAIRQMAPVSPALHLGAERIFIIGVSGNRSAPQERLQVNSYPSLGKIVGHVMNSAFLDSLEGDIERLERINNTIELIPENVRKRNGIKLKSVGVLTVSPSQCLDKIAAQHVYEMPKNVRLFLRGSGFSRQSGASILSYLLFEKGFCQELIELGNHDAQLRKDELVEFILGD